MLWYQELSITDTRPLTLPQGESGSFTLEIDAEASISLVPAKGVDGTPQSSTPPHCIAL